MSWTPHVLVPVIECNLMAADAADQNNTIRIENLRNIRINAPFSMAESDLERYQKGAHATSGTLQ